jgi:hypothetical protein
LYEAATGRRPFDGDTPHAVRTLTISPLLALGTDLPTETGYLSRSLDCVSSARASVVSSGVHVSPYSMFSESSALNDGRNCGPL